MQVHQSNSVSPPLPLPPFPIFILSGCFLMLAGLCASARVTNSASLDPVLRLVVVHRLLPLSQERVHALVGAQKPVHADDGLEGEDAVEKGQRSD